jgi:CHAT domain-containing protein/tetratricopeptide (TPR) repeat protein
MDRSKSSDQPLEDDERLAQTRDLLDQATTLEGQGRHEEALDLLKDAMRTANAIGPEGDLAVSRMLITAATILLRCGRPEDAGAACNQALKFLHWPDHQPPIHPVTTGQAIGTLAHIARVKGMLREATEGYRLAIAMLAEHPGKELALTLSNFGALQSHLGEIEAARATYDQALEIFNTHAPDSGDRGAVLLNRGSVEAEIGWPSRALAWLEEALEMFRAAGDRDREAQTLHALADAHMRLDTREAAQQAVENALAITETSSPDSELHARCLLMAGRLALSDDRPAEAAVPLRHAAERFNELASGSRDAVVAWRLAAAAHAAVGDGPQAIESARAAVKAAEALREAAAPGTPRRGITTVTAAARDDLVAVLLGHGTHEDFGEVVTQMEARLARELLDVLGGPADDAANEDDEESAHLQELHAQRREFERALAHHHWAMMEVRRGDVTPMSEAELDKVAANITQGLILIDQQLAGHEEMEPTLTCAEIQAGLPPDEAIIMTFDSLHGIAVATITTDSVDATALSAEETEAARNDVLSTVEAIAAGRLPELKPLAQLSRLLVGDIGPDMAQLTIVPDGNFHGLPWALLLDPHKPGPIGVTRRLVHASSVTTTRLLTVRRPAVAPARELLVLADPSYTADQIPDESSRRLEGTEQELAALQQLVGDVEPLTRTNATEANLLRLAPLFRRLHLACHGAPDATEPHFGGLLLAEPTPPDRESGFDDILQPWEIASLRLGCETVVLSACSSGLGALRAGEGLVGLTHAFHLAGARQVLASLWPVGDDATVTIMRDLYAHVNAGAGLGEALRLVRRDHVSTLPPKQWAAWVAYGPDPVSSTSNRAPEHP